MHTYFLLILPFDCYLNITCITAREEGYSWSAGTGSFLDMILLLVLNFVSSINH
jgi:hypothetical protein